MEGAAGPSHLSVLANGKQAGILLTAAVATPDEANVCGRSIQASGHPGVWDTTVPKGCATQTTGKS